MAKRKAKAKANPVTKKSKKAKTLRTRGVVNLSVNDGAMDINQAPIAEEQDRTPNEQKPWNSLPGMPFEVKAFIIGYCDDVTAMSLAVTCKAFFASFKRYEVLKPMCLDTMIDASAGGPFILKQLMKEWITRTMWRVPLTYNSFKKKYMTEAAEKRAIKEMIEEFAELKRMKKRTAWRRRAKKKRAATERFEREYGKNPKTKRAKRRWWELWERAEFTDDEFDEYMSVVSESDEEYEGRFVASKGRWWEETGYWEGSGDVEDEEDED